VSPRDAAAGVSCCSSWGERCAMAVLGGVPLMALSFIHCCSCFRGSQSPGDSGISDQLRGGTTLGASTSGPNRSVKRDGRGPDGCAGGRAGCCRMITNHASPHDERTSMMLQSAMCVMGANAGGGSREYYCLRRWWPCASSKERRTSIAGFHSSVSILKTVRGVIWVYEIRQCLPQDYPYFENFVCRERCEDPEVP